MFGVLTAAVLASSSPVPRGGSLYTGGEKVSGWTVDAKGWWHARLPSGAKCSQLFVNGQRRVRPCVPRRGWFYMDDELQSGNPRQMFRARVNQIDPAWAMDGVEACVVHTWTMSRLPVESYDPTGRVFRCACPEVGKSYMRFDRHHWYRLENVREALGEPGDWYLDKGGELTYVPLPGERPETAEAWAGLREHALVISGQTNIVIRGATFAYTGWNMPANGQSFDQAGANVPAAVLVTNSRNVRFENCLFAHTGGYGLEFGPGAVDCAAVGCDFYDLGAGGVKIGCAWEGADDPANWATGCIVENCRVEHGGRFEPAGVGLWIGNANHCRLTRNTIRDLYYTGISVGWTWSPVASGAHHNLVEYNDISDIGQGRLSDMGGIYTLGLQPGTEVIGNSVRNVTVARGSGFAMYFDQGSSFINVVSNYFERGHAGNLFLQYSTISNVVRDNVFVCGRDHMLRHSERKRKCEYPTLPTRFVGNRVWWDDPRCNLMRPYPASTNFLSFADNAYCTPGTRQDYDVAGFAKADFAKPLPPCAAGCDPANRRAEGLASVPAVFDPAPAVVYPDETAEIQRRIDAAAEAGGGTVEVAIGPHHVRTLVLKSGVTLFLRSGARLVASRDTDDYPGEFGSKAIIQMVGIRDAGIVGEPGSVIDGANSCSPEIFEGRGVHGILGRDSTNLTFRGYTFVDCGNYAHWMRRCADLTFDRVRIEGGHDGCHFWTCDRISLADCDISSGDDCVAGFDNRDVVVRRCRLNTPCQCVRFGGRRVLVEDCDLFGPGRHPHRCTLPWQAVVDGLEPKGQGRRKTIAAFLYYCEDGVPVRDDAGEITIRNCRVRDVERLFHCNFDGSEAWARNRPLRDIRFENVTAEGIGLPLMAVSTNGCPTVLAIENCRVSFAKPQAEFVRTAKFGRIALRNVKIEGVTGALAKAWGEPPALELENVTGPTGVVRGETSEKIDNHPVLEFLWDYPEHPMSPRYKKVED